MRTGRREVTCPVVVGREVALELLASHHRTATERGVVTLIEAPAGMGKTRLTAEATRIAEDAGHLVLAGECRPESAGYEPFSSALARYERTLLPAETDLLFSGRSRPARVLLPAVFPHAGDGRDHPPQLQAAVVEVLRQLSAWAPVTLVLEDLQWAGRDAIELLLAVAAEVPTLPVWVVATVRPGEALAPEAMARLQALVERRHPDERVVLRPFEPDQVATMLRHTFPDLPLDPTFAEALHARSDGNPFVVEELCRALLDEGRLDAGVDRDAVGGLDIPATVRTALLSRLDRTDEDTRRLLAMAAVAGEELDPELLRTVLDWPATRLDAAVGQAVEVQVLTERRDGPVPYHAFTHALTREAVLGDLDAGTVREAHRRLADHLEQADGRGAPGLLGDHLVAAGEPRRAFPHVLAAARRAASGLQPREAARRYEQALHLAPADESLAVAVEAAEFGFYADRPQAVSLAERARRLARAHGDREHEVRALVALARTRWVTGDPEAFAPFERALALTEGRNDELELLVTVQAAYHLVRTGWFDDALRADRLLERAGQLVLQVPEDVTLLARMALVRGARARSIAELEAACADAAALMARADDALDDAGADLLAGHHLVLFHGDLREGARRLRRHQRVWDQLTTRRPSVPFSGLAMATMWMGDGDGAQRILAQGYWVDSTLSAANWHEAMAQLALARGRTTEALAHAQAQMALVDEVGEPSSSVPALANLARAQLETSGFAVARPVYERALDLASRSSMTYHWSFSPSYARALDATGDIAGLARLAERLADATAQAGDRGHDVAALRLVQALDCSARGDHDRAAEAFAEAEERYEAMPFPSRMIGTSLAWARAEHRAGRTESAARRAQEALVRARALEGPLLVERAQQALDELGRAGRRAATSVVGLDALTGREREVVDLTVAGLTAKEVGEQLVISHRTVEGHLERARDKLGATSKADLVRLVLQADT